MQFARRSVPNDHECLFTAVALQCEGSFRNAAAQRLRALCAEAVLADQDTYCEVVLGKPPAEYAKWIVNPFNWGGEVELNILAKHFRTRIDVIPMAGGFVVEYNPEGAAEKVHLLYTGQHYDALVGVAAEGTGSGALEGDADGEMDVRRFACEDAEARAAALACAAEAQAAAELKARQRVKKVLKCDGCGAICADNAAFQAHCGEVEHDDDFMFMCHEVEVVEDIDAPLAAGQVDLTDEATFHTFYNAAAAPFSNFYPAAVELDGVCYPTVEHFWQAAKFPTDAPLQARIRAAPTVQEAHLLGQNPDAPLREDWDEVKGDVLLPALRAKFNAHVELREALLATGDKTIVNVDSDRWAGMQVSGGVSSGQNHVGLLLMQVRSELHV